MKTLFKILRFLYLLIIFTFLAIFGMLTWIIRKIWKVEFMFLFRWNDKVLDLIGKKIENDKTTT